MENGVSLTRNSQLFDSARSPLFKGVNLVEASAGTGKTYAISMLVLRFITELEIQIDQILIVTFTKAATEELKDRIRSMLVKGRNLLLGRDDVNKNDTLEQWAAGVEKKDLSVHLLDRALIDIDKAPIYTIHGFCQRMLQDQALESGQLFDVELVADISRVRGQVVEDFWRQSVYGLKPVHCSVLTSRFKTPEHLYESVKNVSAGNVIAFPEVPSLDRIFVDFDLAYDELTHWFQFNGAALKQYFEQSVDEGMFKASFAGNFTRWWVTLEDFFLNEVQDVPEGLENLKRQILVGQLDGRRLRGDSKKEAFLNDWPLPGQEINAFVDACSRIVLGFRVKLFHRLRNGVSQYLRRLGAVSFDDLVIGLSEALRGAGASALNCVLANRYRVGLIDEFQDTDSAQYHIFSTIFSGRNQFLYLIGDPKQAIYKFRGADIFSYFKARKAAAHQLTLETNYRSHPLLVQAVNDLFSSHPRPFLFDFLPYQPVRPASKTEDFNLTIGDGRKLSPMVYCQLQKQENARDDRWSSGKADDHFMTYVIDEITMLLYGKQPVMMTDGRESRQVTARDVGVLVRSNSQAARYHQAFSERGIPSIIAGRQTVFKSRECGQLLLLMQALCASGEPQQLKNALSLDWFGLNGQQLYHLFHDEPVFDQFISRFHSYTRMWHKQGFLSMMNSLLINESVLLHLADTEMAQRRLTNIHHLLELVQAAESIENFGPDQTLLWLQAMREENIGLDETELRLESDEETVKIVTMHSAKGLEYPIVFCPFLWYRTSRLKKEEFVVSCHNEENDQVVDLGSPDFYNYRERAVREELAEELRLFYVAVTRASLRCYIMWADIKPYRSIDDSFQSAFGYLLFPEGRCSYEEQQKKLMDHCLKSKSEYRHVCVEEDRETLNVVYEKQVYSQFQSRQFSDRRFQFGWQLSSYSALASFTMETYSDESVEETNAAIVEDEEQIINLPFGPRFGNVVHELLEKIPFGDLADEHHDYSAMINRECDRYGVELDMLNLQALLHQVVTVPLVTDALPRSLNGDLQLALLDESAMMKEMGFYFRLSKSTTAGINKLLSRDPAFTPLSHRDMEGYLTGFVDLVFQWAGRFFILDYKTNYLGNNYRDYDNDRMFRSMQSHNYCLQYWIYTLVLHRYLSRWYPGYSYEQHFGGVYYLFVRGMSSERPANGIFHIKPESAILHELGEYLGGTGNA